MVMQKRLLSDGQWQKLEPLLPTRKRTGRGRPPKADRQVFEGILWVLKTGARWRDLPADFGVSPSVCWKRLRLWEEQGVWERMWRAFLAELDQRGQLNWQESFLDGSFAAAKKGAMPSAKPSAARARSGWWWSTAKVFLWEATWTKPRQPK
jgi:transposase